MSFFEVSGWTVSSAPIKDVKKRKRLSPGHDTEKNHGVEVNFEKLMAKMGKVGNEEGERKKKKAKHETAPRSQQAQGRSSRPKKDNNEATHNSGRKGAKLARATAAVPAEGSASAGTSPSRERQSKKRAKGKKAADDQNPSSAKATLVPSKPQEGARAKDELTALQSGMKSSLDGARFRWINETLYKSDSNRAHSMMREDPSIFREYHKGFRHQVESWPENPVSHYISTLSSYPPKTVVADLGCGDAALARTLIPNGFTVFSFDLVTDGVFVTEADIFGRLPLPGSEELDGREGLQDGQGQVVDVVICALSLMGTNWPNCIREAWRILRSGGELKVAEVTSRFTDVDAFESLITSMGFKMKSKDDRNTHFILFEFTKTPRRPKSQKEWGKLLSQSNLLKPCEYKRR